MMIIVFHPGYGPTMHNFGAAHINVLHRAWPDAAFQNHSAHMLLGVVACKARISNSITFRRT